MTTHSLIEQTCNLLKTPPKRDAVLEYGPWHIGLYSSLCTFVLVVHILDTILNHFYFFVCSLSADRKPPGVGRGRGRGREDGSSGRPAKGIGRQEDGGKGGRGKGGAGGKGGGGRGMVSPLYIISVSHQFVREH